MRQGKDNPVISVGRTIKEMLAKITITSEPSQLSTITASWLAL